MTDFSRFIKQQFVTAEPLKQICRPRNMAHQICDFPRIIP